jgi:formylmethanofuran dehydrogenase subunit B
LDRIRSGVADAALVAGSVAALADSPAWLAGTPAVVIGPMASAAAEARVAIDTGVAGIHEPGTGYRMDDVPLPLTPVLDTPRAAAETLGRLLGALRARSAGGPR